MKKQESFFNMRYPKFFMAYEQGDMLWGSVLDMNALIRINRITGEIKYISSFPEEGNKSLHRCCICVDGILYFTPNIAKGISSYELSTGNMEFYQIGIDWDTKREDVMCSNAFLVGREIWLIPRFLEQPLLIFDVDKKEVRKEERWNKNLMKYYDKAGEQSFDSYSVCELSDTFWLVGVATDFIMEISKKDFSVRQHRVGDYELVDIAYAGKSFWLTVVKKNFIVKWEPESNQVEEFWDEENPTAEYHRVFSYEDRIYILPINRIDIAEVNLEKRKIEHSVKIPGTAKNGVGRCFFGAVLFRKDGYDILPQGQNGILKISAHNNEVELLELQYPLCMIQKKFCVFQEENGHLKYTEKEVDLEEYLFFVKNLQQKRKTEKTEGTIGSEIHREIMRII